MSKIRGAKTKPHVSCLIFGSTGRMGQEISQLLKSHPVLRLDASVSSREILAFDEKHTAVLKHTPQSLVAVLQGADVVIDFSTATATKSLVKALSKATEKVVLIGTTGLSDRDREDIRKVAKTGKHKILMAGNTSLGVATLAKLSLLATEILSPAGFDIEIIESHHRMKADAPSGTAILLAKMIKKANPGLEITTQRSGKRKQNSVGIHAVRGGGVVGEHAVRFIADDEEIQLSHRAFQRSLFAKGALHLVTDIEKKLKPGSAVGLSDFLAN